MQALGKRLISAAIIVTAIISAAIWGADWLIIAIFSALTGLAMFEFYALLDAANIPSYRVFGICGGMLLPISVGIEAHYGLGGTFGLITIGLLSVILVVRALFDKHNERIMDTMGGTFLGLIYIGFLFSFLPRLWLQWWPNEGRLLVMYMLLVVKWTDAGAYFVGCSIGKHKMIPRISPGKSWEGFAGGLLTAIGVSFIVFAVCHGNLGVVRIHWYDALILGIILSLAGVVGDLVESLLKRSAGKKDSGTIIRGMGGFLDVLDSPIFAAPIMFAYAKLFLDTIP